MAAEDPVRAFARLPQRIYLDTCTLQTIYENDGVIFENEPLDPRSRAASIDGLCSGCTAPAAPERCAPPGRTRRRRGRRTCSSATSTRVGRTRCGWPTSATCRPGPGSSTWRSLSTRSAGGSWAGARPAACAPSWSSTRWRWRSGRAPGPAWRALPGWCTTPTPVLTSIRFTQRLAEAGAAPSVGSVGDALDNALAETEIGLFKTELINRRGLWRTLDQVEIATLKWVDWFNNRRLHAACADLTPAEYEQVHYRQHPALAETLVPTS